jgi:hypothetical protein
MDEADELIAMQTTTINALRAENKRLHEQSREQQLRLLKFQDENERLRAALLDAYFWLPPDRVGLLRPETDEAVALAVRIQEKP